MCLHWCLDSIDPSGVLLTNMHVVEDADTVTVKLPSGKSYSGKVVGMEQELVRANAAAPAAVPQHAEQGVPPEQPSSCSR